METFKNSYKPDDRKPGGLIVYNCGSQRCSGGYQWGPGVRDHHLIHYVISGKGTLHYNNEDYEIGPGDAFYTRPGAEMMYRADLNDPWHYCWAGFAGPDASYIISHTPFSELNPVIRPVRGKEFEEALHRVWESRGTSFQDMMAMTGQLYLALSLLVEDQNNVGNSVYYHKAVDYIRKSFMQYGLSVEQIADYIGINRSYLSTLFKGFAGVSPKEYLTQFRMTQASILLIETDLSISTIAGSVGFEDRLYFSRVFHKMTGYSPSEFRKKYKNKQSQDAESGIRHWVMQEKGPLFKTKEERLAHPEPKASLDSEDDSAKPEETNSDSEEMSSSETDN